MRRVLCAMVLATIGLATRPAVCQVSPFPSIPADEQLALLPATPSELSDPPSNYDIVKNSLPTTVLFPAPPDNHLLAQNLVATTSAIAIEANACGREEDYAVVRYEMGIFQYTNETDNFLPILIGKIAWLNAHGGRTDPCVQQVRVANNYSPRAVVLALQTLLSRTPVAHCNFNSLNMDGTGVINIVVTPDCMRQQVNDGIRNMIKNSAMGTGIPCVQGALDEALTLSSIGPAAEGAWDFAEKALVRIMYLGTRQGTNQSAPVLTADTVNYLETELISASGAVSPDSYSILTGCENPAGDQTGTPEDIQNQQNFGHAVMRDLGDAWQWLFRLLTTALATALASNFDGAAVLLLWNALDNGAAWDSLIPTIDIKIPESENHRLMIESSRFLDNQKYITDLGGAGNADSYIEWQTDVRTWLLTKMQKIVMSDFQEYNSRPYTEESRDALVNLRDFSNDPAVSTASQIVLDLLEAKFATGSDRGRRIAPYRRKVSYENLADTDSLYNCFAQADHEIGIAMLLSNQTQYFQITSGGPSAVPIDCMPGVVYAATSSYRQPDTVQALNVERAASFSQAIHHDGEELYQHSPSYTISAGGIRTLPYNYVAVNWGPLNIGDDYGVAMPAVVIPTALSSLQSSKIGASIADLFRFDGVGTGQQRTENLCVSQGFICGINPHVPSTLPYCSGTADLACGRAEADGATYRFFNSHDIDAGGQCVFGANFSCDYYVAEKDAPCDGNFCDIGEHYGVIEIAEAGAADLAGGYFAFTQKAYSSLKSVLPTSSGRALYQTLDGRSINFSLAQSRPRILDTSGNDLPDPGACSKGGVIVSDCNGHVQILDPQGGKTIVIDFSDRNNPTRIEK